VDILLEITEAVGIEELIILMPHEYICLRKEGNLLSEHDLVMFLKGYTAAKSEFIETVTKKARESL
jgi:hypothetical protein